MMDFLGVTSIVIPEGNVVKIQNATGEVLWEKDTSFTITVECSDTLNYVNSMTTNIGTLTVDGNIISTSDRYSLSETITVTKSTVEVVYTVKSNVSKNRQLYVNDVLIGTISTAGAVMSTSVPVVDGGSIVIRFVG